MTRMSLTVLTISCLVLGCASEEETPANANTSSLGSDSSESLGTPTDEMEDPATGAAAAAGDTISLTPENTKITFVGNHTGDDPDPRSGRFESFNGEAMMADGQLTGLSVSIETASIATDIEKLTNHLKGADFFDVRENPSATFQSTSVEYGDDGAVTITGDLTMLGKTASVTIPATVSTENGMQLTAEFQIDRTQFGMNYGTDKIEKMVEMKVAVGG
jgi:polyisoprenoid-binding protein YceI